MNGETLKLLIRSLEETYKKDYLKWLRDIKSRGPFEILISTIISQNTSWRNTQEALKRLHKITSLNPKVIADTDVKVIEEAISPAGLQKGKARTIVDISRRIVEELNGDLHVLSHMSFKEAREWFLGTKGIGYKTADIVLAFSFNHNIVPVDTHIRRIAKRLKLTTSSDYEDIRREVEKYVPPKKRLFTHIALIMFGRNVCKALNPRCNICPIRELCPSRKS